MDNSFQLYKAICKKYDFKPGRAETLDLFTTLPINDKFVRVLQDNFKKQKAAKNGK